MGCLSETKTGQPTPLPASRPHYTSLSRGRSVAGPWALGQGLPGGGTAITGHVASRPALEAPANKRALSPPTPSVGPCYFSCSFMSSAASEASAAAARSPTGLSGRTVTEASAAGRPPRLLRGPGSGSRDFRWRRHASQSAGGCDSVPGTAQARGRISAGLSCGSASLPGRQPPSESPEGNGALVLQGAHPAGPHLRAPGEPRLH